MGIIFLPIYKIIQILKMIFYLSKMEDLTKKVKRSIHNLHIVNGETKHFNPISPMWEEKIDDYDCR